ncbi:helix-turn-helix transcriptional regulator [Armatimonas sp.]|uniref:helix-turn-helix transcriptional regulator n=1 Tax=Armatimonas sp. TaxID=1872638 RepID=UPI00286CF72D|nr:helix-turn-helix transcriptional regulator [Armatimonas sp.]
MSSHIDTFALLGAGSQITNTSNSTYQVVGISNRLRAILLHVPYYAFEGTARLARDTGLAPSSISRIIRGKVSPSYVVVERVTKAISHRLGRRLDARELFTTDGTYPTPSTCELMDCSGCHPPEAWCEITDTLRPPWRWRLPGDWCLYGAIFQGKTSKSVRETSESTQRSESTQKPEGGPASKQVPSSPVL